MVIAAETRYPPPTGDYSEAAKYWQD